LSKDDPLFVDLRIFPERPATINTPEPERLSEEDVVLSLVAVMVPVAPELIAESSLPPHEILNEAKPTINREYKIFFINFLKINNKD